MSKTNQFATKLRKILSNLFFLLIHCLMQGKNLCIPHTCKWLRVNIEFKRVDYLIVKIKKFVIFCLGNYCSFQTEYFIWLVFKLRNEFKIPLLDCLQLWLGPFSKTMTKKKVLLQFTFLSILNIYSNSVLLARH